jgi:hypothetical protein
MGVVVIGLSSVAAWASNIPVTNWDLQAVDSAGHATLPTILDLDNNKVVIEGICLNNPEDMLAPSSQWQIFIQGEGTDLGGTAAWTGAFFYGSTSPTWAEELARLNSSGFREGDRIRITGFAAETSGKTNINERHTSDPAMDFTVELLQAGVGLPAPEQTTIAELLTFDQTRQTGGERYQCRRIKLDNVHYVSGTWASNKSVIIADDLGNSISMRLCNLNFGTTAPTGKFNVIGLGNQENGYTDGYQIWVTRADGIVPVYTISGTVTLQSLIAEKVAGQSVTIEIKEPFLGTVLDTQTVVLDAAGNFTLQTEVPAGSYDVTAKGSHWLRSEVAAAIPGNATFTLLNGDVNDDNAVTSADLGLLKGNYLKAGVGLDGDLNEDGFVNSTDLGILKGNYLKSGD